MAVEHRASTGPFVGERYSMDARWSSVHTRKVSSKAGAREVTPLRAGDVGLDSRQEIVADVLGAI